MTDANQSDMRKIIERQCSRDLDPAVVALADAARAQLGGSVAAVLAYGSCLRGVSTRESLVDLYVLVTSYGDAHASRAAQIANRILPPNVYYLEADHLGDTLRAKVAVVSLDQFASKVRNTTQNPYFWARFAQPCTIAFANDETTREQVVDALCRAVETFLESASGLSSEPLDISDLWVTGLRATYATELRPEDTSRAQSIVAADPGHYRELGEAWRRAGGTLNAGGAARSWFWRRLTGKTLTVLRLIKAAFTFQGGADYIAWKIARHSNVTIDVKPWHRRHPILAAIALSPHLYRKGGFR